SKDKTAGVIAFPDSWGSSTDRPRAGNGEPDRASARDPSASRVILVGEVLFHREALARALRAHDDVVLIGAVADGHAALNLAQERGPDVLIVDSPSDTIAQTLDAHPLDCKIVFIGALGERGRRLQSSIGAIFVGASASLEELHAAI